MNPKAVLSTYPDPLNYPLKPCQEIGAFVKKHKDDLMVLRKEIEAHERRDDEAKKESKTVKPSTPNGISPSFDLRPEKESFIPQLTPGHDGKVNWTPLAELTGTRPHINKYSLSRYSLDEWRQRHNADILGPTETALTHSNIVDYEAKTAIAKAFGDIDHHQNYSSKNLREKAKDVFRWKVEVEQAVKAITEEVELLEVERQRLKGAARTLMLPEAISRECLDVRSNRAEKDLVADAAEQELIKEYNLVGEVRETLKKTLEQIEEQMRINKQAKQRVEYDWCDKSMAYDTDVENIGLSTKSPTILFRPGATKDPEFSAPLSYWEHFCRENILNVEAVRQTSADLRSSLNAILVQGGRKLRMQADKTDMALAETVNITQELLTTLEDALRTTLGKIADLEKLIESLHQSVMKTDAAMKLAQTRLDNRNTKRLHGEAVKDRAHIGLIDEVKKIHETVTLLRGQLNNALQARKVLMERRIVLEQDIAAKRKTLSVDRDRCGIIRSHYPSAFELAGY